MKSFLGLSLVIITLCLNTFASENTASEPATCTAESASDTNCSDDHSTDHNKGHSEDKTGGHNTQHGSEKDWSHKRQKQVSEIFPEKQKVAGKNVVPAKVKLISPEFLSKTAGPTINLEWTESKGAKVYHLQVSRDAGFNNRSMYIFENKNITGTSQQIELKHNGEILKPGTKLFWRVAAYDGDKLSQFTKSKFVTSAFEIK